MGSVNNFERIFKPHYFYRPQQAILRVLRAVRPPREPIQEVILPWGLKIRIDVNEVIGRSIWHTGLYDLAVSEALWRLLGPGDVAVDVGANRGYMTGIMALRVGCSGHVFAFEPHPETYRELQYNVSLFQQQGKVGPIENFEMAVSDRSEEAILDSDDFGPSGRNLAHLTSNASPTGIRVRTVPLDELIERNVATLKLDVEGHEIQVLKGAERLLRTGRIQHIVYEDFEGPVSSVHQFLVSFGYSIYALGWQFGGPVLAPLQRGPVAKAYEPPSYVATRYPAETLRRFAGRGWAVLRRA